MAGSSAIEWTDATWNPVVGCRIISAGCTNCYAMRMAARLEAMGQTPYAGTTRKSGERHVWTGKIHLNEAALATPRTWRKPRLVFVNSMSDLFQDGVPFEFVDRVWEVMKATPIHTYQILTKQPERMREYLNKRTDLPLHNVWVGTSIENDAVAHRLDALQACKAAVRFISFEPLIGSVGKLDLSNVHWAIVGGESGPKSRPIDEAWVREIFDQCDRQDVAFFFKQWGGVNKKKTGREFKGRTWNEMPANLAK
jgi:protein gp37